MKKNIALLTVLAFMLNMAVAQERTRKVEKAEAKKEVKIEQTKKRERVEPAKPVKAEQQKRNDRAEPAKGAKVEHPKRVERAEIAEPARPDMQESKAGAPAKRSLGNKEVKSEGKPSGTLKRGGTPDGPKERK